MASEAAQGLRLKPLLGLAGVLLAALTVEFNGTLRLREAQQREAAITFHRTLPQAWQEVDNALMAFAEAQAREKQVADAVAQNDIALRAARQRYAEGVVGVLDVNTAQAQLLQGQNDLADSRTRIATGLVALCRALGGGWEIADAAGPSRP